VLADGQVMVLGCYCSENLKGLADFENQEIGVLP